MKRRQLAGSPIFLASVCFLAFVVTPALESADWPTYRRDNARSGFTPEALSFPLQESWVYRSRRPPRLAWPGPSKWDGWHKIRGLKDRMLFDRVFHVAVGSNRVTFGSSTEDKLVCVDAKSGVHLWTTYVEGPVRLAPTLARGKVYFGSDDGYAYCVRAEDGRLVWRHRVGPSDRRLPGNGRMISLWPVRSGVVVEGDRAYCAAGVMPWEKVFLCCLDAESGELSWVSSMMDLPAQGYLLASASKLYVTTGRERPVVFDRLAGKRLYQVEGGGGGTYALLTGDLLLYGPGKTGEVSVHGVDGKEQLATFSDNHLIVTGPVSYLHTDRELVALDQHRYLELYALRKEAAPRRSKIAEEAKKLRRTEPERAAELEREARRLKTRIGKLTTALEACFKWRVACDLPHSLIVAGPHLIAGGDGVVAAIGRARGRELWRAPVDGQAHGLAVSDGALFVSPDSGAIHCFRADANAAAKKPGGDR